MVFWGCKFRRAIGLMIVALGTVMAIHLLALRLIDAPAFAVTRPMTEVRQWPGKPPPSLSISHHS